MITEDYVSYETAQLLKEKGFDEATNRYYNAQYDQIRTVSDTFLCHWNNEKFMKRLLMDGAIAIPTRQMAMAWLREVHNLFIMIDRHYFEIDKISHIATGFKYSFEIKVINTVYIHTDYESFEEATETAIKYCLENLI